MKKHIKPIVVSVVVLIVAVVTISCASNYYQEYEKQQHDKKVYELCDTYSAKCDECTPYNNTFEELNALNNLKSELQSDRENFILSNRVLYGYDELMSDINYKMQSIKDSILSNYNATYEQNIVNTDESTEESLESNISNLQSLLTLMESEKVYDVWANEESYTNFVNQVNELINTYNTRIEEIQENERLIAEAEAVSYDDYNSYNSYGNTYNASNSYYGTSGSLTKSGGINYHNGRRETWYSSNALYHYRTPEWTVDSEGFYRDSSGNYVVAASDMSQGTVFEGSKGNCIVLDSGCAAGTTDYYVAW